MGVATVRVEVGGEVSWSGIAMIPRLASWGGSVGVWLGHGIMTVISPECSGIGGVVVTMCL